jgi:hypothetical protein
MSASHRKPYVENEFAIEALSPIDGRRRPVATASHLFAPFAADLSADGVLSWTWLSPEQETCKGYARHLRSTAQQPRKVDAALWRRFAALSFRSDEDIRKFAEKWGPLGGGQPEKITEWRRFANLANALIRCSVALTNDELGADDDWRAICAWLGCLAEPYLNLPPQDSAALGRTRRERAQFPRTLLLVQALNKWFAESKGNNLLRLVRNQHVIEPFSTTLFGILALQLAYRITRAQEMVVCFHCKTLFSPKRAPSHGTRQFCAKCRRTKKPQLYVARDYRRRRNATKADL